MKHHAVIGVTFSSENLEKCKKWIAETFSLEVVSLFVIQSNNEQPTVILCPDGSKEGWAQSMAARHAFQKWLANHDWAFDALEFGDHSSSCRTVMVEPREYVSLLVRDRRLTMLEAGGVDNWNWYFESLHPDGEESIDDYEARLLKEWLIE